MSTEDVKSKALGLVAAIVLLTIATSPLTTILLIRWQASQIVNDSLLGVTESGLVSINSLEGLRDIESAISSPNQAELRKIEDEIAERRHDADSLWSRYETGIKDSTDRPELRTLNQRSSRTSPYSTAGLRSSGSR